MLSINTLSAVTKKPTKLSVIRVIVILQIVLVPKHLVTLETDNKKQLDDAFVYQSRFHLSWMSFFEI
jgi:hypothetical protein